jgi:outer membrane protein
MKNGLLIWNVLLSLVAGYLLILQFNSKKSNSTGKSDLSTDTVVNGKPFRMAYFEMDSVATKFDLVKELKAELNKKDEQNNRELEKLSKNFQDRYNYFQNQAQAGTLTQTQSEAASNEIKRLDEELKNRKQQLDQEYNDFMVRRQNEIKSKIEAFIKEYNKTKGYSYVVSDDPGLFYYQDSVYNITADVIKGLNELYKPVKKN